jgi:CHAT domain-containing protein/Tfp pilus assembly protein PilF
VNTKTRWLGLATFAITAALVNPSATAGLARFTSTIQAQPQAVHVGPSDDAALLKSGVVVEEVEKKSAAAQAGIQAGDVLLSWSRGDAQGPIESPFDFSSMEIEQGLRGVVTLVGMRGDEKKTWEVGPDRWGINTRPNFQSPLLNSYLEGLELAKAGKLAQAVEHWRAEEQNFHTGWLRTWFLFHIAESLADAKRWQEADRAYQEAVDIEASDAVVAEQILRVWGKRFFQRNDMDRAEKRYREALAQSRTLGGESLTTAVDLDELGLVFNNRYDLPSALEYFRKSLAIKEQLAPGSLTLSDTLQYLSLETHPLGDLTATEAYLLRALAIAEHRAPETERVATALWRLGIIAGQRVNLIDAEQYLRRAIALEGKISPGSLKFALMLGSLGSVLFERGDLAQAEDYYLKQIPIFTRLAPGGRRLAAPLNNLGNVALERGDLVKAEDYYRQALAVSEKADPRGLWVANHLNGLGDVFLRRGDFAEAAKFYEQALAIRNRMAPGSVEAAESMHSLGDAERAKGEPVEAEEHYRQALEIRHKLTPGSVLEADTLAALALIMQSKQQPDSAAQMFEQALNSLESQYARLGGSQDIRSGYRAKFDAYYRSYIGLLVTQKQPELAFHVLERSRARSLLEMLVETHLNLNIHQGVDPQLLERERTLQSEIAAKINRRISVLTEKHTEEQVTAVTKEIEGLVAQYQELEGQIRAASPAYSALTQPQPLSAKEIQQQLLDPDTLLLEYSLGEERSHVFAVTRDSLAAVELSNRADIEQSARRFYGLLTERNRRVPNETQEQKARRLVNAEATYNKAATELGRMILGPVAKQVHGKRLVVVADGALHYVPFAALTVPVTGGAAVPLAAQHEIVTLPSASVLAVLRREQISRKPGAKTIAVLADPVFDRGDIRVKAPATGSLRGPAGNTRTAEGAQKIEDESEQSRALADLKRSAADVGWEQEQQERSGALYLPRLLFTRQEANEIAAAAPPGQSFTALDFKASRATAVSHDLANYRIVHFATHAFLNSEHPELSGLVLSLVDEQGKPQNGFLDLEDIYNLNLPADLVVLSACETGLGKKIEGEGLVGLTRGFMYAGATRVIASLWKIDDRATAEFMRRFYAALLGQKMRPAAALRAAQLAMRNDKRWNSPYYWAAFQIQGEWK